jgi:hypothetical protein
MEIEGFNMRLVKQTLLSAMVLGMASIAGPATAQSTDGFHTIQVFPVVVDSSTFTQRFFFRNPNNVTVTIVPRFVPGEGTAQASGAGAIDCPAFDVLALQEVVVDSLRDMCPAMAAGSGFGFLYTYETNPSNLPYAGYSRVSNNAGNGFSVEAFPAHTFTSSDTSVTGLRRLAATASSPAFQSNCFIANLNDFTAPGGPPTVTSVDYGLYTSDGSFIAGSTVDLEPGRLTRLLDVFGAAGAPAGDYNNASIYFQEFGGGEPGLMTFCTVQDNTSFGADFRIGKQEFGFSDAEGQFNVGGQDDHVLRDSTISADILGRPFEIPAAVVSNTHVMYFRHPDRVQCEIIDPATGVRADAAYGLEMRLLDKNGAVVAGGNEVYGFGEVYLGDKTDRANGNNTRYTIQVESTETNTGAVRPYRLHCQSGSGHTLGDLIEVAGPDRF